MSVSLGTSDWLVIGLYIGYLGYVIFHSFGRPVYGNDTNYILAGRKLTLPAFVATLVSTWYGGILGVGEFTWLYGISNWVVFGLPYYIFAVIFALFFAKKIRRSNLLTLPDQFELHYGKKAASFSGFLLFIVTLPAPYLLMLGYLIKVMTGLNLYLSILLGSLFSILYIFAGGFNSIVRTDKIQFLLMFGGFILAFFVLNISEFPFWRLSEKLPDTHFTLTGGNSMGYILGWFIIAAQTLVDPNFYQRTYAAKTPETAKKGILISIGFWALFDFLTTVTGLYARALFPDLAEPALSFPLLGAKIFPPLVKGLFFTGMLATIMSSVDSFSFVSAVSLGRDSWQRLRTTTRKNSEGEIRTALVITAAISIFILYFERSIIGLWYQLGSVVVPSLLIPLLLARLFPNKINREIIFLGMIVAAFATAAGLFFSTPVEPIYIGLMIQFVFSGFSLSVKR